MPDIIIILFFTYSPCIFYHEKKSCHLQPLLVQLGVTKYCLQLSTIVYAVTCQVWINFGLFCNLRCDY